MGANVQAGSGKRQLKSGEVAKILGANERDVRRLAERGLVPAKRPAFRGAHWRFFASDLTKIRETLVASGMLQDVECAG